MLEYLPEIALDLGNLDRPAVGSEADVFASHRSGEVEH